MKLLPRQLNYLHTHEGKLYAIDGNNFLMIDAECNILEVISHSFEFEQTEAVNYFVPYGKNNLIFQKNKLFSLQGPESVVVKEFKQEFSPNIHKGIAMSKDQLFRLDEHYNITVYKELQCICKEPLHVYYFGGEIGVELEEETSYYNVNQECLQIPDSCVGNMLLCYQNYIIDEKYAYYDIATGQLVFPKQDSFDILSHVKLVNSELTVAKTVLREYQPLDYDDQPYASLFGYQVLRKQDEL